VHDAPKAVVKDDSSKSSDLRRRVREMDPTELQKWKQDEMEFIKLNDVDSCNIWLLVDVRWLKEWKAFIKSADSCAPGPIDNTRLIDSRTGFPRPDLVAVEHYRGVNLRMWKYLVERYGGGPEVRRRQIDLYSPAADDLEDTVHNPIWPAHEEEDLDITKVAYRPSQRDDDDAHGCDSSKVRALTPPRVRSPSKLGVGSRRTHSMSPVRSVQLEPVKPLCCDKCDGAHESDDCPHFSKVREKHKDAWGMLGKLAGGSGVAEEVIVSNARVVRQPGDGSCLFHSLSFGLSGNSEGLTLRKEICDFISRNPDIDVGDNPLKDWVTYEGGATVQSYASKMGGSAWGGGIEMAAFTKMKGVHVHVYESCGKGYKRISFFESPGASKTVSVLYQGRAHYDALVL